MKKENSFLYIFCIGLSIFLCKVLFPLIFHNIQSTIVSVLATGIGEILGVLLPGYFILGRLNNNIYHNNSKITSSHIIISIILIGILSFASKLFFDGIQLIRLGASNDFNLINIRNKLDLVNILFYSLMIALLPAVCEEYLYRYLSYKYIKKNLYILVSASLFTFAHIGNINFLYLFILGAYLAYIYQIYRSYIIIVILHTVYNLIQLIFDKIFFLPSDTINVSLKYETGLDAINAGIQYLGESFFVLGIILFFFFTLKKSKKINNKEETEIISLL